MLLDNHGCGLFSAHLQPRGQGARPCSTNGSIICRWIVAAPHGTPRTGKQFKGVTDNAQRSQQASELPRGGGPKSKDHVSQNA